MMPVIIPKAFHGCETQGGVHTAHTTRRRSASMRCVQRRAEAPQAALPLCKLRDVQFGEPLCRGDHSQKIRGLCGRSIKPLDCYCGGSVVGGPGGREVNRRGREGWPLSGSHSSTSGRGAKKHVTHT